MTSFGGEPGSIPGMDLSTLDFFHIQVDDGGHGVRYSVSFNNLELTHVPEPASFALVVAGLSSVMFADAVARNERWAIFHRGDVLRAT